MKKYYKLTIYFAIVLLLLQLVPQQTSANGDVETTEGDLLEVLLVAIDDETPIVLFEDETEETVLTEIPDETVVELIEEGETHSEVRYLDETTEEEPQEFIGFVHSGLIEEITEETQPATETPEPDTSADSEENPSVDELTEEIADPESGTEGGETDELTEADPATDSETVEEPAAEETEAVEETTEAAEETTEAAEEETEVTEEATEEKPATFSASTFSMRSASIQVAPERLEGLALKQPTNVYSSESTSSKVLKSYNQGHTLIFKQHNASWFKATVYVKGSPQSGYIHANDVSLIKEGNKLSGYANVDTLNVHESNSANSKVLKSYKHGHALVFRTYSSEWFKATVYVSGKAQTGYIKVKDISFSQPAAKPAEKPAENLAVASVKGVAAADRVHVYSETSRNSGSLKSYARGHVLTYRQFNSTWHQATVYVNGKAQTGYIHTADVENIISAQTTKKGIGLADKTHVYSSATANSKVLKSYNLGHVLTVKTYTANWYEATVIISGERITGYIKVSDIGEITANQETIKGIGIMSPTHVYSSANTGSKVLKSYSQYTSLTYKTFAPGWYEATVYVNGVKKTGYISASHVQTPNGKTVVLDAGHGGKDPGAMALGLVEKELNLDIALRAEKLLKNAGYTVVMTRSTDIFLTLDERSQISNKANADLFVSIHGNKFNGAAKGIETFWYGKYESSRSQHLAVLLQNNLVAAMGLSYRRVASGNYHVIRETKAPSSLVEVGFLDHPGDAEKLRQSKYRQYAAQGIFAGVVDFFK